MNANTSISGDITGLGEAAPTSVKGTVKRGRLPNRAYRSREHLTPKEIERLMAAARKPSRNGHRDDTRSLTAYLHVPRASPLCALPWDQVDFALRLRHVPRLPEGS